MAFSPDTTSMALFCDFENVALGVRDTQHEKFDIKLVLERLLVKGSIVVKKAYCDWERYRGFKAAMHEANFELIEIPHVRQSGKNSADIRLVVDALDLCYTKAHVNTFVIISGDSDFSPLVSKLRENNKQVIGVGVKQSTSDLLTANCDEFIFYDDLVREVQRSSARRAPPPPPLPKGGNAEEDRRREETLKRRAKGVELAVETLEALVSERADGSKIWSSVLKEAIKRRRPDFNESYFGFRGFSHLLEEAQTRGLLELARDEKSNVYITRSNPAPAGGAPMTAVESDDKGSGTSAAAQGTDAGSAADVLPFTHRVAEGETRERGRKRGRGRNGSARNPAPAQRLAPEEAAPPIQEDDDMAEHFADAARHARSSGSRRRREDLEHAGAPATQADAPAAAHVPAVEPAPEPPAAVGGAAQETEAAAPRGRGTRARSASPRKAASASSAGQAAPAAEDPAAPAPAARKSAAGSRKTPARPRAPRKSAKSAE